MNRIFTRFKIVTSVLGFLLISIYSNRLKAQCTNTASFGTNAAPGVGVTTLYGTTCLNEYNTLTAAVAGVTYVSTHPATALNTYVTVRSGSSNGAVVAHGFSPLMWTAAVAGNHYIHYNTNAACGATCSNNLATRISRITPVTTCSSTFTDAGGGSDYASSKTDVWVFYPANPGEKVRVTFTAFATENNFDGLMIYNGNSNLSPLITSGLGVGSNSATCPAGSWRGGGSPGTITSTAPDGSLTFVFMSDGATTAAGWSANVTCFSPCATVAGTSSSSITNSCGSTNTTLSLTGEGAGTIQWQQSTDGGSNWSNIVGATTDPYVHNTSVSTMYRAAVTNGCTTYSATSSITMNCIITHPSSGTTSTTIQCGAGTYTYYDPGGTGNYNNDQLGTLTINPSSVGQMVQINFGAGAWFVEDCGGAGCDCDWLKIYNGTTTAAPLIGTYCNGNVPGVITSTTGSLTIVFDSDPGTVGSGWVASVTCFTPCATVAGTSSSSLGQACAATNTTLSLAGEGAGTIQWQQSTDGGANWSNIVGATTDPYVFNVTVSTMFRAAVTSGCTSYSTTSSTTISCDITHPASGFVSTTIQCGSSYTYRDPGITSDYSNDQNGLITLCPSTPGQYINVNFTAFNTQASNDLLYVFDGNNAGDEILGVYSGNGTLSGNVKATSSNTSGCLSFRFASNGSTVASGWQATVTCNATPSATVPSSDYQDCQGAYNICSGGVFTAGTNNFGMNELPYQWNSCLGIGTQQGENESVWAVFSPATSGTIGFSITPTTAADYDWAIWGPYSSLQCPAFTNDDPIRCSSTSLAGTGGGGTTGLIAPAVDVIEQNGEYGGGANENGKLRPLDVLAGEIYIMMLDNWSANTTPFTLTWNLTNGATLDCTPPLPVTMASINNTCKDGYTLMEWTTASEVNNDYFAIERSDQKFEFYEIGRVRGAGNSNNSLGYSFIDPMFNNQTTYYRIKQVDYNGEFTYHRIVASNCYKTEFDVNNEQLTSNSLDLNVNSFQKENVTIYLYDVHGKLITESFQTLTQGNNKINLTNFNINSGIYMLNIVGEVHHYQTKLFRK
jgi:hypothetical protein